jgi:hypothetical protein
MSPRHFANANNLPINKDVVKQVEGHRSLWFAFTTITGIAKLFSYTPDIINTHPVKDLDKVQGTK